MKNCLWGLLLLGFCDVGLASQTSRPNVIFILADDLGYGDLGCYGRNDIRTPNLDQLARDGVRFTQHYANGPECTPTRTAFLTGRYQQWVGGLECAIGTGNLGRYDDAMRLREQNELGLPTDQQTIVRLLKEAGYATGITGKWHLGYEPKFAPHLHGFDYTFYCTGGGMDYFHYLDNVAGYNLFRDGDPIRREGYFTDLATDEAIKFIDQHEDPFFLYLPYTCPHSPFQGPDDFQDNPLPLNSPLWRQSNAPPDVYIAMIERMDQQIGRLLAELDRRQLRDNTVVMFAGDNGGTRSSRNAPLSGFKGSTFEGGIRVPAIVRWPNVIPPGVESHQVSATFDFTASIAALGGVAASPDLPFEGIDIVQRVAEAAPPTDRTLYWRKPRGETVWKGVRQGSLKFVAEMRGDREREYLFDLASDLGETVNLKDKRPEEFHQLRRLFNTWEERTRRDRRGQEQQ